MADENTGIAKIRESLGELTLGRSDRFVVQMWLNTLIESAVQHPRLSTFAPFQEYFVDQRPIEDQLSSFLADEFSSLIPSTDETQMTTFRLALADQLSTPKAFTTRFGDRLVISDLYQTLFSWLANADALLALNTAQEVVRNPQIAEISLPDSQPLVLFLFRALNMQLATKSRGRSLYQAVFQFALDDPDAVAADIPDIIEANVCALGDDNDMLRRLFSEYSVLRTAYRRYLSNHYPKLLEKYEDRFMARIKAALPRGFSVWFEALDTPLRTPPNTEMTEKKRGIKKKSLINYNDDSAMQAISPLHEMGAYEALWAQQGMTWERMADKFRADETAMPSDFIEPREAEATAAHVMGIFQERGVKRFGVRINHAADYPTRLRDAKNPVEMLYFQGTWELSEMPGLCIVGSRNASEEGKARAARLARELVERGFVVVSGLATGIDTAAHTAALEADGWTIAVIGTPLGECYPKDNRDLQAYIAEQHLLVSQVPVIRYSQEPFRNKRHYFPERNATMSALTEGTIIVEAGETSGTLTQARAAIHQGRKIFILESCFQRDNMAWPAHYEKLGAIRVRKPDDIWSALEQSDAS